MSNNGSSSYLEVQNEDGDDKWNRIGTISSGQTSQQTSSPDEEEISLHHPIHSSNTEKKDKKVDHKIQLPLSIKNILSPNAKIKSDRRSNYMYRHSSDKMDTNLLILFHGAGDSHLPFHALAKKMDIPQTASLSIHANSMNQGFVTLPFDLGYTWFDEMDYTMTGTTYEANHPKRLSTLEEASEKIDDLVLDKIIMECNGNHGSSSWVPERIFLFGFSAGAAVVMNICHRRSILGKRSLGGAICIAGGWKGVVPPPIRKHPLQERPSRKKPEYTPLLLMGGEKDQNYPVSILQNDAKLYSMDKPADIVKTYIQKGKGHEMVRSKEEVECLMEFFAEKMVRRMIAMEGWSEVSSFK